MNIHKEIIWIPTDKIVYCTPPSVFTDLNQHDANRDHPHAYYNRGYFKEGERNGDILEGNWDTPDLRFDQLLEFIAIKEHMEGKQEWRYSDFAQRGARYIELGFKSKGFESVDQFLHNRQEQINKLIANIRKQKVLPVSETEESSRKFDDISVNISRSGEPLFNNRGVHRLSIAKLLDVEKVPVQVVVWHKIHFDNYGFSIK